MSKKDEPVEEPDANEEDEESDEYDDIEVRVHVRFLPKRRENVPVTAKLHTNLIHLVYDPSTYAPHCDLVTTGRRRGGG